MNCLKCGYPLNTEFKCEYCGTQYQLIEKSCTTEFDSLPYSTWTINHDEYSQINPKEEYIEWEY